MAKPSKYLIVGGSAAGMAAAHTIRAHDPQGAVTILSEEPDPPYFRPMIPFMISGKKEAQEISMDGCGPYTGQGIAVKTDARVVSVDTEKKSVSLDDGQAFAYEKLLIATGSRPHIPTGIHGTDATGVFALRTLTHARQMAQRAKATDHAVMLGGGLLNLKAAFALLERGIKVTLVVYSPEVLSQLMEPEDALLLRKALDKAGLQIRTGTSATGIRSGPSGVTGITLDDGTDLSCQMVCIGKGVRPNVEFLNGSGIRVEDGIVADAYTCASAPDTHTAGDVAVTFDPVTGDRVMTALWTNAVEMGRCAGQNMAGVKTAYAGTFGILNATQVADEPFVSMGIVHTKGRDLEVHTRCTAASYGKMVFDPAGDRLVGALFVGDITNAGIYRYVIRNKTPVAKIKHQIIDHTLHYGHFLV